MSKATSSGEALKTLVKSLQALASGDDTQLVETFIDRNSELEKENEESGIALDVASKRIAKLTSDVEAGNKLLGDQKANVVRLEKEKTMLTQQHGDAVKATKNAKSQLDATAESTTKLQTQLKAQSTQIDKMKEALKKERSNTIAAKAAEDKANNDLRDARAELQSTRDDLGRLNGYAVTLDELNQEEAAKKLQDVFNAARSLVAEFVGIDLDDAVLSDHAKWTKLKGHVKEEGKSAIPLPRSNAPIAKHMRVAFFLAILARLLDQHIFRSTYVTTENNELSESVIELKDKRQANHLRAVLLRSFPYEDGEAQKQDVVDKMRPCIELVLGKQDAQVFQASLEKICHEICEVWKEFQRRKPLVTADFEIDPEFPDEWKSLPRSIASTDELSKSPNKPPVSPNGFTNIMTIAIWPVFIMNREGDATCVLLRKGFALNELQMREAKAEEQARDEELPQGSRRLNRERHRSEARKESLKGGQGNSGRSFLSRGAGDGS